MTMRDWTRVIDQLADLGTRDVQFIGGEPTLNPGLPGLIQHAHTRGLSVEVFSNMTHIRPALWQVLTDCDVRLATSYYSDAEGEHDAITGLRGSHRRTRANIEKALALGIRLRSGIVTLGEGQRAREAALDLSAIGVGTVGADRARAFGRAAMDTAPRIDDLCGHCAHEKIAIGPDGDVWPCVLGRFLTIGNVLVTPVADLWSGPRTAEVIAEISAVHGEGAQSCTPPQFLPMCGPCGPCVPSVGHCDPKDAARTTTIGGSRVTR
jgi:radical SAM protein with 4Fe4S-binding SPASM domain